MVGFPFMIRVRRIAKGHSILGGRSGKMTREQFEARLERERWVKHSIIIELFGGYYELPYCENHAES